MIGSPSKRLLIALAFLLPNVLGFLVFTAWPIVYSFWMSLTDFALTKHNELSGESPEFVGLENYQRLLTGDESHLFWDYFGNTAYLMIGIPLGIAGSLGAALLLHAPTTPKGTKPRVIGGVAAACITVLACLGVWMVTDPGPMPADAVMSSEVGLTDLSAHRVAELRSAGAVLATATLGVLATLGMGFGSLFFRTIFYLPSLLAGVAMFLLWKTLYRPQGGLINAGLQPILDRVEWVVERTPGMLWRGLGVVLGVAAIAWTARFLWVGIDRLRYREVGVVGFLGRCSLVACFVAVAAVVSLTVFGLPGRLGEDGAGFTAPQWLISSQWAKTALVIMGVWLAIGGGNMLLYLAGLSNIPPELYEAADIDGASGWQRFIHVTWPQLAPTTFFIVVMSTIGGLQGGFEQALVMTEGKADTIVLAYYIYQLAFTDQFQLGLASAVAWVMCAVIFGLTILNYRLGSTMTND